MINQPRGGGRSMFKFFLLSIFAFLLFAPKSHALIDYTVLDGITDKLTYVVNDGWRYNDTNNVLTFVSDSLFEGGFSGATYDFRLHVCPDKDVTIYTSSDCSVFDRVNVRATISGSGINFAFDSSEIDADNISYLVLLMEEGSSPSNVAAQFEFYTERVIDTTVTPAQFSDPPSSDVNVAPVGTSFTRSAREGASVGISFLDPSGDSSSAKIVTDENTTDLVFTGQAVTAPSHGTVEYTTHPQTTGGGLIYTHDGSETLTDTFTFTVADDEGATSNVITASLTITPTNDAPVGVDFSRTLDNAGFVEIYFSDNTIVGDTSSAKIVTDPDVDDTVFTIEILTANEPQSGTAEYIAPTATHPSGGVKYTHDGSDTISDDFYFKVIDDEGAKSNRIKANITINALANTVVFANSPINITEGEMFNFNPIASDTENLVDRLAISNPSSIAPFPLLKLQNGRVVVNPALDTANEYIFSSTGGADEPIIPYNLFSIALFPKLPIGDGSFTIIAYDSDDVVIGSKVFTLTITTKNLPTAITTQSPILLEPETEADFNIEFTNPDGDDILSNEILIENKPSWLTVGKERAEQKAITGIIRFTGTVPATFDDIDMTIRVPDRSKELLGGYAVKVFRIKKSGTLDFDDNGETDTIDANFLYT